MQYLPIHREAKFPNLLFYNGTVLAVYPRTLQVSVVQTTKTIYQQVLQFGGERTSMLYSTVPAGNSLLLLKAPSPVPSA